MGCSASSFITTANWYREHPVQTTINLKRWSCSFGTAKSSEFKPQSLFCGVGYWVPGAVHSLNQIWTREAPRGPGGSRSSRWFHGHMTAEAPPLGAGPWSRWYFSGAWATGSKNAAACLATSASLIPAFRWHLVLSLAVSQRAGREDTSEGRMSWGIAALLRPGVWLGLECVYQEPGPPSRASHAGAR